jgi:thiol-disulfide isomerase/thioredoxin
MKRVVLCLLILITPAVAVAQGRQAPGLTLTDINGRSFNLNDYKGKVVLINFWATWCAPCRAEIPDLIKMQRQYRNHGLRIIGITYPPQKRSEVRRFARALKINYRVAIGTEATKDLFTNNQTLPMTIVVDRNGSVRAVIEGIMYSDEFDQTVKPLFSHKEAQKLQKGSADF